MLLREAARMQGLRLLDWRWPAQADAMGLLGNSVAQAVVQRILVRLLPLLLGGGRVWDDPWQGGSALARLASDARDSAASPAAQRTLASWVRPGPASPPPP